VAFRNPQFLTHHAMRLAGAAAIGGTAMAAGFPVARVFDSAGARRARFGGVVANQFVKVDRGAGFAALPALDRLLIPAGHTLDGCTVEVRHHTSDPADGITGTLVGSVAVTGSALIELALSPAISNRWALVNFATAGTAWEVGELWLGTVNALTMGSPEIDWRSSRIPRLLETTLESGATFRAAKGATRRGWRVTYKWLDASDLVVFDALEADTADRLFPFFWYDFDSTHGPVLVELVGDVERTQDHPVPRNAVTYSIELELREATA